MTIMHYIPNVEMAFNSVEHTACLVSIIFLCAYFLFKVNIFIFQNVSLRQQLFNLLKKFKYTGSAYAEKFSGLIPTPRCVSTVVKREAEDKILAAPPVKDSLNNFSAGNLSLCTHPCGPYAAQWIQMKNIFLNGLEG